MQFKLRTAYSYHALDFSMFSIYVYLDDIHQIFNLTPEHQHILSFLGSSCQKYY
jgi:hypothetical protein